MVKTSWTVLKIGIHWAFGPNSPKEFGTLDLKIWPGLVYICTIVRNLDVIRDVWEGESDIFTLLKLQKSIYL